MRLWHYELISYLPRTQLLAQWRELNSIFVNQPNHILIDYVYDDKVALYNYSEKVIDEMIKRGYKISQKSWDNFCEYFKDHHDYMDKHIFKEHDGEYLQICYWNLREKYRRGQKDFTAEQWYGIEKVYYNYYKGE